MNLSMFRLALVVLFFRQSEQKKGALPKALAFFLLIHQAQIRTCLSKKFTPKTPVLNPAQFQLLVTRLQSPSLEINEGLPYDK